MGTKLHPPYPNQDCLPVFWSEKCLQCLKNVGLYNSFGIGRFSLWHSWLTRASRLANSQASASNAGVPGDPNSPESNCWYLALIWSVKELYSLCASCTVNKETGFGMTDQVLSFQFVMSKGSKEARLVSMKFKSQLWEIISKYPPRLLNRSSRTAVSKDQRVNQVRLANYANELSGKWLEILRKSSRQKLVCEKSKFCKIQGMSKGSKLHATCCMVSCKVLWNILCRRSQKK